jgi:hypothetical protein
MDADPEGRMICELSNWTGKAYRIPRGKVKDCANRPELKKALLYTYYLVGQSHLQVNQEHTSVKLKMLMAAWFSMFQRKNFGMKLLYLLAKMKI